MSDSRRKSRDDILLKSLENKFTMNICAKVHWDLCPKIFIFALCVISTPIAAIKNKCSFFQEGTDWGSYISTQPHAKQYSKRMS